MSDSKIIRKTVFIKELANGDSAYRFKQLTFDKNDLLTEEIIFNVSGDTNRIVSYSYEDGRLAKEIHKTGEKNVDLEKTYYYDNSGKLKKIESKGLSSNTLIFEFLDNGQYDEITFSGENKQWQRHFNASDHLLWEVNLRNGYRTDYLYDDSWNLLETKQEHDEGHTSIRHQNEYDDAGNLTKVYINGNLSSSYSYKNGLIEKEVQHGLNDEPITELTYRYEFF